ncbi:MAG: hypothetical protein HY080_04920 [Gammaproteobacteria bacterium]|nr:hypothetical protein [Gammaproteobacteria bacterium]
MEIEELVLKESLVSVVGVNSDSLQVGIRGDPSMRETTCERKRYSSSVDEYIDALLPNFEELLLKRSAYQLFIGFNNGEIRVRSVFDPMREEVHAADKMADGEYLRRQFPAISYDDKIKLIRDTYVGLRAHPYYQRIPEYWKNIMLRRSHAWIPMQPEEIRTVVTTLKTLRDMPTYYMRNVTINMVQSIVRIQFNCDGTQIVSAGNYRQFLIENLPH